MNSTSFTSTDPNCATSNDKNIDSSSTAHLTLNASNGSSGGVVGPDKGGLTRSSNSSDPDASPSVTVRTSSSGNGNANHQHHDYHHHGHSLPRPSHFLSGGFLFSNRLHLTTKHQRTLWSRATHFEKILMLTLMVLCTVSVILLILLASIIVRQRGQLQELNYWNSTRKDKSKEPGEPASSHNSSKDDYCLTPNCVKVAASVIGAIDQSVDPCDNFYLYSCGDWIKSNPLPDGKSNWGTFNKLWQDNQAIMRSVLEDEADFEAGSAEEKAKIFYESCLDRNETVELRGAKPMQDLIERAGGWNISGRFNVNSWDLQESLQILHNRYNRGGLFFWTVGPDERNSTRHIIQLDQGGLSLPNRDYYVNKSDKDAVLSAYLLYMTKVAELMGGTDVEEQMRDVLEFEMKIARISVPADQRRDDERMYHKFTLKELNERSPFMNWTKYYDDAFEYHSMTKIDYPSEIRPGSHHSDEFKNQTRYTITSIPAGQNDSNKNNGADTFNYSVNNEEQSRPASAISKKRMTDDENVVVYSPEFFEELSVLIQNYTETDRGKVTLANYMAWQAIQSLISTLPKSFRDASKVLRKAMLGTESFDVNWRFCVTETNAVMGFALGKLFVRRVFHGDQSKERAGEMISSIIDAFNDNLVNLSWMDDKTRALAHEKADNILQMIGFPDFILNSEKLNSKYEGLVLDEKHYFENTIKVNVLSLRGEMDRIDKPANRTEWDMTPPTVNAYYTPTKNQIVFPAGILQTPFYDLSWPNSLNYGAMGVVMGHEITHGFDDQGREYDKDGNLRQWWCNETVKNFEERSKCLVEQYSSYKIEDAHVNGKQTLGENIADNGGLKAAFRAYEKWSMNHQEPRLPGLNLTNKQLFFVGFAQVWCSISTPEALKLTLASDPHVPPQYRVIGTLSNTHEFAREFNCPSGTKMNPEKKCEVW